MYCCWVLSSQNPRLWDKTVSLVAIGGLNLGVSNQLHPLESKIHMVPSTLVFFAFVLSPVLGAYIYIYTHPNASQFFWVSLRISDHEFCRSIICLVVWNICFFFHYVGNNTPNWHQPVMINSKFFQRNYAKLPQFLPLGTSSSLEELPPGSWGKNVGRKTTEKVWSKPEKICELSWINDI